MSPKRSRKRPWSDAHRELNVNALGAMPRTETGPDGYLYQVQYVGSAAKTYVCPACRCSVPIGSAHVVAWPSDAPFGIATGVQARRHWHTQCWKRGLRPL